MIAFKVSVNEKDKFITGIDDWDSLHAVIMALRAESSDEEHEINLKIGGLAKTTEPGKFEHMRWPHLNLKIGDEVSIAVVDVDTADEPINRFRSDKDVQEVAFTDEEILELQKQDYLRLKEKFKNEEFA